MLICSVSGYKWVTRRLGSAKNPLIRKNCGRLRNLYLRFQPLQDRRELVAVEQASAAHLLIDGDILLAPQPAYRLPYGTLAFECRNI